MSTLPREDRRQSAYREKSDLAYLQYSTAHSLAIADKIKEGAAGHLITYQNDSLWIYLDAAAKKVRVDRLAKTETSKLELTAPGPILSSDQAAQRPQIL